MYRHAFAIVSIMLNGMVMTRIKPTYVLYLPTLLLVVLKNLQELFVCLRLVREANFDLVQKLNSVVEFYLSSFFRTSSKQVRCSRSLNVGLNIRRIGSNWIGVPR